VTGYVEGGLGKILDSYLDFGVLTGLDCCSVSSSFLRLQDVLESANLLILCTGPTLSFSARDPLNRTEEDEEILKESWSGVL
jgi:hypothetical protein